jgi:long-subunit acyl-CoA synthetase (AMP-forming)
MLPAGAVLTHSNLIASAAGTCTVLDRWGPGDRHICYLPLAHIYERINLVGQGAWLSLLYDIVCTTADWTLYSPFVAAMPAASSDQGSEVQDPLKSSDSMSRLN